MAAARAGGRDGQPPRRRVSAPAPPQHLLKRSFRIAGHRTSIALEAEFWQALEAAAERRGKTLAALIEDLDAPRAERARPLASTLRVFALGEPRS